MTAPHPHSADQPEPAFRRGEFPAVPTPVFSADRPGETTPPFPESGTAAALPTFLAPPAHPGHDEFA